MLLSELIEKLQSIQEMNPKAEVFVKNGLYVNPVEKENVTYDCDVDCIIEIEA